MIFRVNRGCLIFLAFLLLVGGTPLALGIARLFIAFTVMALVGSIAGYWWIRKNAGITFPSSGRVGGGDPERHDRFVRLLVHLLVHLAELDGELDRREVTAIRTFFQNHLRYSDDKLLWIRDLIKESRRIRVDVVDICTELKRDFSMQERFVVLQVLARVAQADGDVTPKEMEFIDRISSDLGLDPFIRGFGFGRGTGGTGPQASPAPNQIDKAFGTLGLKRGASKDEIKATWRKLSMENHPDRVTHLGDEFRELADERMSEINAAYETLKDAGLA